MAYTAGMRFGANGIYGSCTTSESTACTTYSGTYNTLYGTCVKGSTYYSPSPCLIGSADVCPTTTVSVPALDVLVDTQYADVIVTGALMAFAVGFGIGMVIRMIRKLG